MRPSTRALAVLSYLPAFEAAAKHLSFKRAAAELHLTPSAVSQQMRALESTLGLKLFRRMTRALALTPAGEQYAAVVSELLDRYRRGTEQILRQQGRQVVRVSTDPFVAHEVLIPALDTFKCERPAVDLRIETSATVLDLDREELDAAIRYGIGPWPGLTASKLCDVIAAAVCAPGLVKGDRLRSPAALAEYPLIRLRDQPDPWERTAEFLSIELPRERLVFDSYFACVRAAEKGLGIAVAIFPTTAPAVVEGRLVTPLPFRVRTRAKFHFVCRRQDAARPALLVLRDWAQARFAALPALPEGRSVVVLDES